MGAILRKPLKEFRDATDSESPQKSMQNAVLEDDPRSPTVGIHRTPIEVTPTSKMGAASNSVLENSSSEDPNESPMAAYQKNPVRPSENLHREVLEASLFPKFSAQMSSTAEPTAARS